MKKPHPEWLDWLENICFRCLLVSFGILCFWASGILFADALILSIHGKFLGIGKSDHGRFEYDAKMIHYQFLDCFKLGAMLLFFIPWLFLRLSRGK